MDSPPHVRRYNVVVALEPWNCDLRSLVTWFQSVRARTVVGRQLERREKELTQVLVGVCATRWWPLQSRRYRTPDPDLKPTQLSVYAAYSRGTIASGMSTFASLLVPNKCDIRAGKGVCFRAMSIVIKTVVQS